MATLTINTIIDRDVIKRVAIIRLQEARKLYSVKMYTGTIYLAGYSVECYLKLAICKILDIDRLPGTFMTHDLEALILHAGLSKRILRDHDVHDNFAKLRTMWTMTGKDVIRYKDPKSMKQDDAKEFLSWVAGNKGVVTWLKKQN